MVYKGVFFTVYHKTEGVDKGAKNEYFLVK